MSALCTFITPSRKRPQRLLQSIASIEASAPRSEYRIHIRTESDDPETQALAAKLLKAGRVDLVIDGPHRGYSNVHMAWSDLLPVPTPWLWVWSDDTQLFGNWVEPLKRVPLTGVICHAEFVTNNASTYQRSIGGPFPIVPGNVLESLGWSSFQRPIDMRLDQALRIEHGWKTEFLDGVTVKHDRHIDATLDAARY